MSDDKQTAEEKSLKIDELSERLHGSETLQQTREEARESLIRVIDAVDEGIKHFERIKITFHAILGIQYYQCKQNNVMIAEGFRNLLLNILMESKELL